MSEHNTLTNNESSEEQWFWSVISSLNLTDTPSSPSSPVLLVGAGINAIYRFQDILAEKLANLDGPAYYEQSIGSSDGFLYNRAYVVAKGQEFYEDVVRNPGKFPSTHECQRLLGIPASAYHAITGTDLERVSAISYESFWNKKLWKEEAITIDNQ